MAPTLRQVATGIEDRLATISGLRVNNYPADQINPPQAVVEPPVVDTYHATMHRGKFDFTPTVVVFTSAAVDRVGMLAALDYQDPNSGSSVHAAIEGDRSLGGVVDDCWVTGSEPLGLTEVGAIGYYGVRFTLRIVATGR